MHSPAWPGNEYRRLDRLRSLQVELARVNEVLKDVPPRYQAEAARLMAANDAVLRRGARLLAKAGERVGTDIPRRSVRSDTVGYRFLPHHKVSAH